MANPNWYKMTGTPGAPINVMKPDPGMYGRGLPSTGPTTRTVPTVPVAPPWNNPAVSAINNAVPSENGSIDPNKSAYRLDPSPPGLPANYGESIPGPYGGSWPNFADTIGSAWPSNGQPAGAPSSITVNGGNLPPFDWSTVNEDSATGYPNIAGLLASSPASPGGPVSAPPPGMSMYERNPTYRALVDHPVSTATTWGQGGNDMRTPVASQPLPPIAPGRMQRPSGRRM